MKTLTTMNNTVELFKRKSFRSFLLNYAIKKYPITGPNLDCYDFILISRIFIIIRCTKTIIKHKGIKTVKCCQKGVNNEIKTVSVISVIIICAY